MALNDNEGWDGIDSTKETLKAPERIKDLFKAWQNIDKVVLQTGPKSVSGESPSEGSPVTSTPVMPPERYYGFLDESEIVESQQGRWRIQTYDCIGETIFWKVLDQNAGLYQVLENRHNSASKNERQNRTSIHHELFKSKYEQSPDVYAVHRTIHFLDRPESTVASGGKEASEPSARWGWSLIEVTRYGQSQKIVSEDGDAISKFLQSPAAVQQSENGYQLWAPLLTDAELDVTCARIILEDSFFNQDVVPFLEEIFSLHHIPDADIWGDEPTPLDPAPPPIVLSHGFSLEGDVGLWTGSRFTGQKPDLKFTGRKLTLNLDSIRQLPPKMGPRAHITGFGWFDIWRPTEDKVREEVLYLLNGENGAFWGFRLKIEKGDVLISETFSEGVSVEDVSGGTRVTSATAGKDGEISLTSGSPTKPSQQSQSSNSVIPMVPTEGTSDMGSTQEEPTVNTSSSSELARISSEHDEKPPRIVTNHVKLKKVEPKKAERKRAPLQPTSNNIPRNVPSGGDGAKQPSQHDKENTFPMRYISSNY